MSKSKETDLKQFEDFFLEIISSAVFQNRPGRLEKLCAAFVEFAGPFGLLDSQIMRGRAEAAALVWETLNSSVASLHDSRLAARLCILQPLLYGLSMAKPQDAKRYAGLIAAFPAAGYDEGDKAIEEALRKELVQVRLFPERLKLLLSLKIPEEKLNPVVIKVVGHALVNSEPKIFQQLLKS